MQHKGGQAFELHAYRRKSQPAGRTGPRLSPSIASSSNGTCKIWRGGGRNGQRRGYDSFVCFCGTAFVLRTVLLLLLRPRARPTAKREVHSFLLAAVAEVSGSG